MRARDGSRAMLLVLGTLVAGVLAGQLGVGPAAAAPAAALLLGPDHGSAGTTITAQLRTPAKAGSRGCPHTRITFKWDGRSIARATLSSSCVATARFRPPKRARGAGPHQVTVSGVEAPGATFTIGGAADTSPPTPTAQPSESLAPVPVISDAPLPPPSSLAAVPGALAPVKTSDSSSLVSVPLLLGALLVLAGGGILTTVILRGRRKAPEN